jgi:hypothetical protein
MKIKLFVDGQEGVAVLTPSSLVWCDVLGIGAVARGFEIFYDDVEQLQVAKKTPTNVKITVEKTKATHLLRFLSIEDAAIAVDVISGKCAPPKNSSENASAIARSDSALSQICSSLADDGLVPLEMVDEAVTKFRGVLHVFDALNELVASNPADNSLELRPITDQMLSDIFHQLPLLAHLYAKRVHTPDDKVQFVESVVKKYFCYKLTSLDEVGVEGEAGSGRSSLGRTVGIAEPASTSSPSTGEGAGAEHLAFINSSSANALLGPTVTNAATAPSELGWSSVIDGDALFSPADISLPVDGRAKATLSPPRQMNFFGSGMKRPRSCIGQGGADEGLAAPPSPFLLPPCSVPSVPDAVISRTIRTDWKPRSTGFVALKRFWQSPLTEVCPVARSESVADDTYRRCLEHAAQYEKYLVQSGQKGNKVAAS